MIPQDTNEGSDGGLPPRDGSPSSLTPETDAMLETDWHRLEEYSAPLSAYKRMTELCRTLERERDEWRGKAVDLHARHKGALEDIEAVIAERDKLREERDELLKERDELLEERDELHNKLLEIEEIAYNEL